MTGTKAGAKKAAETNMRRYGNDFYRVIGKKGGENGNTGGFQADPERAKLCGRIGGSMSRRYAKTLATVKYKVMSPIPREIKVCGLTDEIDSYMAKTYGNGRDYYYNELGKTYTTTVAMRSMAWRILQALNDEAYIQIIDSVENIIAEENDGKK